MPYYTSFECLNCGTTDVNHAKYYDGDLGYEATICKRCGATHDQYGMHVADEMSLKYVGLKVAPKIYKFTDRDMEEMTRQFFNRGGYYRSDCVNVESFLELYNRVKEKGFLSFK